MIQLLIKLTKFLSERLIGKHPDLAVSWVALRSIPPFAHAIGWVNHTLSGAATGENVSVHASARDRHFAMRR
jgi:hypothetical protein